MPSNMFSSSTAPYDPKTDIPSLIGKVIVITGSNGGLGYESLIHLARHSPAKIYLCARSKEKYDKAMEGISAAIPNAPEFVKYRELDLASLSSVQKAANKFLAENDRLDILMNNAGIMAQPPGLTEDGFEIQFGTNHMGHALFTKLLLPLLTKTAAQPNSDVRIVNLTSDVHMHAPKAGFLLGECLTDMLAYSTWTRYGQSKLANILFTTELARRYPSITSVTTHPGGVATNLLDSFKSNYPYIKMVVNPFWKLLAKPASTGAWNQTWAATAPVEGKAWTKSEWKEGRKVPEVRNGAYYTPVAKEGGQTKLAKDPELARQLWEWTEEQLREKGY